MKDKIKTIEFKITAIETKNIEIVQKTNDKRLQLIDFQIQFDEFKNKYEVAIIIEERDDDDDFIINILKKKRSSKHFDSFIFIDNVNFIWREWKFKIHDKMTINHDH